MSADDRATADPGSCSALAAGLSGTAYRLKELHRDLGRLDGVDLGSGLAELDEVVTDLVVLGEAVQRLAGDLAEEHGRAGPTVRARTRSGRSHAAVVRAAHRIRPVP